MKYKELKSLEESELKSKLAELRKDLIKLSAQAASGTAKNPGQIKQTKKTIARILTIMNQKVKEPKKIEPKEVKKKA